jgi:hypothetical protein
MSSASASTSLARLIAALDTLDRQVAGLEAQSTVRDTHANDALAQRHAALKADVQAAITELDAMLNGSGLNGSGLHAPGEHTDG